jgi:trigger factor
VKAVVEPLEGNKVKLSVEVDELEFDKALDAAFRKIAREVRIPGFRPGKAPRRVLEARLGTEGARQEALRDALPDYYAQAVRENDVDVIAPPEIDITGGQESGPVAFDAVVEIRPRIQVPGYAGLQVTVPNPVVADEDVEHQVDRLRANFGELSTVSRPARDGDFLTIDLHITRGGEVVEGSTDDYVYELGSRAFGTDLDDRVQGARVGDILAFDSDVPDGGSVNFRVLVKEIREKLLPEVTDEWAAEASEFETADELRADIRKRLSAIKRVQAMLGVRNGAVQALTELVGEEIPDALVNGELEGRIHDLGHRLEAQRATIAMYLEATGQTEEQLLDELRGSALEAVKADLALRAVADAEEIEVSDDELEAEVVRMAERMRQKPAQVRRALERAEQMPAVRSDLRKSKALEWLVEHIEVVDEEGDPIDRAELSPPQVAEDTSDQAETEGV